MKLSALFLLISISVSAQQSAKPKHVIDPRAVQLNDSAINFIKYSNPDSAQIALSFLNRATEIDSNYYLAYYHKLGVQTFLKKYTEATLTAKRLVILRPRSPDLWFTGGYIHEVSGDTATARAYYQRASVLYQHYLDTIKPADLSYFALTMNAGVNLIMLGQPVKGNEVLKRLYNQQKDVLYQETIAPYMNKTRDEIIARLTDMPK